MIAFPEHIAMVGSVVLCVCDFGNAQNIVPGPVASWGMEHALTSPVTHCSMVSNCVHSGDMHCAGKPWP